jgi:nucleoside-diphosphate-sugar epimerase
MLNGPCIVTGAAGFIGTHLIKRIRSEYPDCPIWAFDIANSLERENKGYRVRQWDIVNQSAPLFDAESATLFHLAALAREPGYAWDEYFRVNLQGTRNVVNFAVRNDIHRIIFTSTMMVYAGGDRCYDEEGLTAPYTAYGFSKLAAELVLREWAARDPRRRLRIVRPGVVFGKGERGNFTRLYNALRTGRFVYVGRRNTVKSCVYVKDLTRLLMALSCDEWEHDTYNVCYLHPTTVEEICAALCAAMGSKRKIPVVPYRAMRRLSFVFELLNRMGLRNPIHHRRIEKLYQSTCIDSTRLSQTGFEFEYPLHEAIEDWLGECGSP